MRFIYRKKLSEGTLLNNPTLNDIHNDCLNLLYNIPIEIITELNMFKYLHNRIGTIVLPNERNMLINSRDAGFRNINVGELIAVEINNIYTYCVFIKDEINDICSILTTQNIILNKP